MYRQLEPAAFAGAVDDAFIERPHEHRGEQREHIHLHGWADTRGACLILILVLDLDLFLVLFLVLNNFQAAAHALLGAAGLD